MRRFFPPNGRNYHLFDTALLTLLIGVLWYITTDPSTSTQNALDETLLGWVFSPVVWGWIIFSAGTLGVVASYIPRLLDAGYVLLAVTLALWAIALLIGAVVALLADAVPWEVGGKALGTSLWFFYALRNLVAPLYRPPAATSEEGA